MGPPTDTPILQVQRVTVRFGPLVAVKDLSLDLHAGQLVGLIGPNGAGKTTLLRAIAAMQPATSGVVRILGQRVKPASSVLRHVGFTADSPPMYEEMTVRDFLRFIGRGYELSASETDERIGFWLEQVWLTEKAGQKVKALSRGMRQRLGLARALLPNPLVILLDEPAAGLDPAGRVQLRQLLINLRDQGRTLIVSSHNLADMGEYCTHIAIMSRGQVVRFGTVNEVADQCDGERCLYHLVFTQPIADICERLSEFDGISRIQANRDRVTLEFSNDRTQAAELLARLIGDGLPVAAFAPQTAGLEAAYLRAGIEQVD